ncbi:putative MFS family arabinose efflux permease [Lacrimispora xylanisolvens]|uniref:Putative MFS family arabinose efflux permease n=1 Tax=Lacrimispora xylanisolvens TaxID=384636 RepID=A0A2S6HNJ4_9FIRM|nr:MFS transporter [Hungatella xylanolytica]PPK78935.1 putative MFS family arabinose efflux permease [Hungatella xylanolytica]
MNNKRYYPTAFALYFSFFIHGIGASILSQYKTNFARAWGAGQLADGSYDVSTVVTVIAALGLGRLLAHFVAGPFSDRYGRKLSGLIGVGLYVIFFAGIILSPNMAAAYCFAILGGAANSFLDTCVSPTCMEIFVNNGSIANMFTKFSMCVSQFLLPFFILLVGNAGLPYTTLFIICGAAILADGLLILLLPFPEREKKVVNGVKTKQERMKFTPVSVAAILIGFTSSSTFMLWLNCNKELGQLYGMTNPSLIQSYYAAGTAVAIIVTAFLIKKGLGEKTVLILYPAVSTVMLLLCYWIRTPQICIIGGFVIGYAGAGGVLQLAVATTIQFFPENKATATSFVMIASSVANYTILSLAGYLTRIGGSEGPRMILLLNAGVTFLGVMLAVFVKVMEKRQKVS